MDKGRPKTPTDFKILTGNAGKRELPEAIDHQTEPPKARSFLRAKQINNLKFDAAEIYRKTYDWIAERKCVSEIPRDLVEMYAMCYARYIQIERDNSEYGVDDKDRIKNALMYQKQALEVWNMIVSRVNLYGVAKSDGEVDEMERILNAK